MKKILCSMACMCAALASASPGQVEIWIRGFIPDLSHAGAASSYIKTVGGHSGSVVTLLPINTPNYCFATDHRGFSFASDTTSRLETRFTIAPVGADGAEVLPGANRTAAAITHQIDCTTGGVVQQAAGRVDRDHMGAPSVADGTVQVIGQAQGTNVIPLNGNGPSIDYSWDVKWQPFEGALSVKATYGNFPAFEMYARTEGGSWTPVYKREPLGTPWDLGKDDFGLGTQTESQQAKLFPFEGSWQSDDDARRFTVEFRKDQVILTERSTNGTLLVRNVTTSTRSTSIRLDRPNDAEVLTFLGFQPALRSEILARNPNPSFLVLRLDGKNLVLDWNGLLVIKDDKARLKELVQPGTRSPRTFTLRKVG